jgi:hypothetical protein
VIAPARDLLHGHVLQTLEDLCSVDLHRSRCSRAAGLWSGMTQLELDDRPPHAALTERNVQRRDIFVGGGGGGGGKRTSTLRPQEKTKPSAVRHTVW